MISKAFYALSLSFVSLFLLAACENEAVIPQAVELTREANGNYCAMIIVDHPGPKAQVHEKDRETPLWFSSVRDALAYLKLPGEAQNVLAFYVHDMGKAQSWEKPQNDGIWVKASEAVYVIESTRRGGMGTRETVPFSKRLAAERFVKKFGGRIVAYGDIPNDYILGDDGEYSDQKQVKRGSQS